MMISSFPRRNKTLYSRAVRYSVLLFFLIPTAFLTNHCADSAVKLDELVLEASHSGSCPVAALTLELEDISRPTQAHGEYPGSPTRTLVTEVWYPSREDGTKGEFPLILFSHGFTSFRTQSDYLTEHLASHGYVVVAPDFPLTNGLTPGGAYMPDVVNQPGDLSFLIDVFVEYSHTPGNQFHEMISEDEIGALGHSFGGLTTILASHGENLADSRIQASFAIAPFACFLDADFFSTRDVPIFIMGGDIDIIAPFESNMRRPYSLARPPKYLVEIAGATHLWFMTADMPDEPAFLMLAEGIQSGSSTQEMMEIVSVAGGNITGCAENLELFGGTPPDHSAERGDPDRQREVAMIYATAFFGRHLKGEEKWERVLSEDFSGVHSDLEFFSE